MDGDQFLPPHPDYSLTPDPEVLESFPAQSHHPITYSNGSALDASLQHAGSNHYAFTTASGARFISQDGLAPDTSSFRPDHLLHDSATASISPSLSSAAPSLQYTTVTSHASGNTLPPSAYTTGPVPHPGYVPSSSHAGGRSSSIPDSVALGMPQRSNRHRNPTTGAPGSGYRDTHDGYTTSLGRNQFAPGAYTTYDHTPRTVFHHGPLTTGFTAMPPAPRNQSGSQTDSTSFPWSHLEILADMYIDSQSVTLDVKAAVASGFFPALPDGTWTCYRRNYFAVQVRVEMMPYIPGGILYLKRGKAFEQIVAIGVKLTAAVDDNNGKAIELIKHTPKRDNGPKKRVEIEHCYPAPPSGRMDTAVSQGAMFPLAGSAFNTSGPQGPRLPMQTAIEPTPSDSESNANAHAAPAYSSYASASTNPPPGMNTSHTFDRIQFKQATANNGKRRASQQYFVLRAEVYADIRKEGAEKPVWIKVAQRTSERIVVRGRSPSHYAQDNPNNPNGRGSGAGAGGSTSFAPNMGSTFGNISDVGYRPGSAGYGPALGYHHAHHCHSLVQELSPVDSFGSGDSLNGEHMIPQALPEAMNCTHITSNDRYRYFPGPIKEVMRARQMLPTPNPGDVCFTTDPSHYKHDGSEGSKFRGYLTSAGHFPASDDVFLRY